ncbi:MAG: hypothetical protein OES32_01785 [Acidobacteriota bacterium]|nr:hypothetical protein [Acidobacteriota bacterium]MDH3522290.1 hypothetical protein [Acidobacteriota bacterium]
MTAPPSSFIQGYLARLKFPQLFMLAAGLFLFDLVFPDFLPFIDEILLAIGTLVLGSLQKKVEPPGEGKPPIKDVTPRG